MKRLVEIIVRDRAGVVRRLREKKGVNLREALLHSGFSPYQGAFRQLNCMGMGICGSCKIIVHDDSGASERRACRIRCYDNLEITLK